MKFRILCVIGTRPEVIKMAPIILQMKEDLEIDVKVLSLAQHRELLDQMLSTFKIVPDFDLNLMSKNQTLPELTARLPIPLDKMLEEIDPHFVLAQGDTTSTLMTSLACGYRRIPFGHVEGGLRTYNYDHPFPEEMNRVLISKLSTLHFAPTPKSRDNLLKEGFSKDSIFVTGNTVIDALQMILKNKSKSPAPGKKIILVTLHRRESWKSLPEICRAIKVIAQNNHDVEVICPVHPNPNVSSIIKSILGNQDRIVLTDPLDYLSFISLMQNAYLILSDSGGIQEEAPALGVPVLILRETTERPEGVEQGLCRLIGMHYENILFETQILLDDASKREKMVSNLSPYGDGNSAQRIIQEVKRFFVCKNPSCDYVRQ